MLYVSVAIFLRQLVVCIWQHLWSLYQFCLWQSLSVLQKNCWSVAFYNAFHFTCQVALFPPGSLCIMHIYWASTTVIKTKNIWSNLTAKEQQKYHELYTFYFILPKGSLSAFIFLNLLLKYINQQHFLKNNCRIAFAM